MKRLKLILATVATMAAVASIAAAASAEVGFSPNTTFTGEGAAGKFVTLAGTEIACGANTLTGGTMKNNREGKIAHVDFTKCKALGTFAANSLNDSAETILLDNAIYNICFIDKAKLDMGFVVHLPSPGVHVEVPAAKTLFWITGWVIGLITPDATKAKVFEVKFGRSTTTKDQEVTKCEGGATEVLLSEINEEKKPEEGALVQTEKLTMAAQTELVEA